MDVVIRKATIEDLPEIQKLSQELYYSDVVYDGALNEQWTYQPYGIQTFTSRIEGSSGICFVAEANAKIVSYVIGIIMSIQAFRPVKRVQMENLIVSKEYRGKGIGEKLTKAFLEWAKEQGMERAMVSVYVTNEKAIRFYHRVGFAPDSLEMEIKL